MTQYTYQPVLVIDVVSGLRAQNSTGYFLDKIGGNQQTITDLSGGGLDGLPSNSDGITPAFQGPIPYGFLVFGTIQLPIVSNEAFQAAIDIVSGNAGAGNMISVYRDASGNWPTRPSTVAPPDVTCYWIGASPEPTVGGGFAMTGDVYLQAL